MTTNQGLRSELISRVHKRASTFTIPGVFPLYYGSADGSTTQPSRERLGALIKEIGSEVPIEVAMMFISPAQGAVFAPLALKFVKRSVNLFIPD
jgi:hypothetical protein